MEQPTTLNSPRTGSRALRTVAAQIRHRLSDMQGRSNVSWPASTPAAKTSGYVISEVADWQLRQWLHIVENVATLLAETPEQPHKPPHSADGHGPTRSTPGVVGPQETEGQSNG